MSKFVPRPACRMCGNPVKRKPNIFCGPKCPSDYAYYRFVERWLRGEETGIKGKTQTSGHIRRYLKETRGEKCELCGWAERNKTSGNIPVELEHTDGTWTNNRPDNIRLLCPNCHSLTSTFRGLNRGKGRCGRKWLSAAPFRDVA